MASPNTQRLLLTPTGTGKNDLLEVMVPPQSGVEGQRINLLFPPGAHAGHGGAR